MTPEISAAAEALRFGSRENKSDVETGTEFSPKFDKDGLITSVATDALTGEVLMVAYMNEQSLRLTLALGEAVYYSRSRQELWHKGATSGHVQKVVEILTDCDQDALVLRVNQLGGGACHTGYRSCFYRHVVPGASEQVKLETVIAERAYDPKAVYGKGV
jgi:phosphoribosyl-AMP cyclohydrolase